jgi:hypothetical protein
MQHTNNIAFPRKTPNSTSALLSTTYGRVPGAWTKRTKVTKVQTVEFRPTTENVKTTPKRQARFCATEKITATVHTPVKHPSSFAPLRMTTEACPLHQRDTANWKCRGLMPNSTAGTSTRPLPCEAFIFQTTSHLPERPQIHCQLTAHHFCPVPGAWTKVTKVPKVHRRSPNVATFLQLSAKKY